MKLHDVESSNLGRIGYEPRAHRLVVQFRDRATGTRDGAIYEYDDVPARTYRAVFHAESVGRTFNQLVKEAGYRYRRIG